MYPNILTDVNRALAEHLSLPSADLHALVWHPVAAGSSNQLMKAELKDQAFVLRVNASDSLAFGCDRDRESKVLEIIAGQPWAPLVIKNSYQQGWCLMKWHGETVNMPLANPLRKQLLEAVNDWQQKSVSLDTKEVGYVLLFERYRAQTSHLPTHALIEKLLNRQLSMLPQLPKLPIMLVHHDLHSRNLCLDKQRLVVIDWEYAGWGNAWFDAAALAQEFTVTSKQLNQLPAFRHLSLETLEAGLTQAIWLLDGLECLWYWARGLSGSDLTLPALMRKTIGLVEYKG